MQKIDGSNVHVILKQEMIEDVDRVAGRLGITRSESIRRMLDLGLEVFHDFEKIGVVRLVEIVRRTKSALKDEVGQQELFRSE